MKKQKVYINGVLDHFIYPENTDKEVKAYYRHKKMMSFIKKTMSFIKKVMSFIIIFGVLYTLIVLSIIVTN